MKKLFTLLLILCLLFTLTSCGNADNGTTEIEGDGTELDVDTSELDGLLDGESEEDYSETTELGLKANIEYAGSVVTEKLDYNNIANLGEDLQGKFLTAANLIGKDWNPTYYYDDSEDYGVGDYLEVQGMEEDNEDLAFMQAGVYKDLENDCYKQFLSYCSDSIYPTEGLDLSDALSDIETVFGVTVSKDKLQAAAEKVFKTVEESGSYYCSSQEYFLDESDYSETIVVSFESDYIDDETYIGYVYCCRERQYK